MRLVVQCPAKINTFLAVGPKDSRGYHPLRTVFQAVGLFDTLTVEEGPPEITSDWTGCPPRTPSPKPYGSCRRS
jgi:4-diphosphocytidyl-2C-methyl-D-erythritol kinase